uniref:TAP42-like protein n=1 Tax=Amphora coffeiformis TaxID=265554 RepID=A0A7S3L4U5_9STRA
MTEENESMSESFSKAVALISSGADPAQAVEQLVLLQERIARAALFSTNETLEDISTAAIPLLALPHHLAVALVALPTIPANNNMKARQNNLERATDLWSTFLRTLERLEILAPQHVQECQLLEDLSSSGTDVSEMARLAPPTTTRDSKIARFQAKQQAMQDQQRLTALQERRQRLGVDANETLDGHDDESLQREMALKGLEICIQEAIEEWTSVIRELPMIARMVQQQQQERQVGNNGGDDRYTQDADTRQRRQPPNPQSMPPLQLTHITQDPATGRIQVRRDTARKEVFRRGWNQPTMTIEELADHEVADAMARAERQKQAEAAQAEAPRRYEQLVKDGMEDRADLVEASAALDRKWDDWKDENPRGSGNKRGDVGDRNF